MAQRTGRVTVTTSKDEECSLDDKIVEAAKTVRDELRKEMTATMQSLRKDYEELKSFYQQGLKNLEAVIKNLSTPQVTLTLPPRKTTVTKSIVYGQTGRPDKIVEETEER